MKKTAAEIRARRSRPLTREEANFAAQNFGLVGWYLSSNGLWDDDWYDAVILRYLDAVKKWHEEPELRVYRFATIAAKAMRSAIGNERQKRSRRPKTVSLYEVIPGTDRLTREHLLADPGEEAEA